MKSVAPPIVLALLFLTAGISSVAASGYSPGPPTIHCAPYPACLGTFSGTANGIQATGALGITYPDGTNAAISESTVTLRVCGTSGCTPVLATLTPTGAGGYRYSFNIPHGITGPLTIILPAGSLSDVHGTSFPNVNTVIGTFTTVSTNASTSALPVRYSAESPSVMHTTQPLELTVQPQINLLIPALLAFLSIAGVALAITPTKRL
jgi:hypothetical protein